MASENAHPYAALPSSAYWRTAVADVSPFDLRGLWSPKFELTDGSRIATAGSCFAQHISRAMKARGHPWVDSEPAPPGMSAPLAERFGYGVFSFRTGNIYTSSLLRQWMGWALSDAPASDEVWEDAGRWFDPFRPAIHPDGFASEADLRAARATTLRAIRRGVYTSDVLLFTLGLTESWENAETGAIYPVCPGTVAGRFDPQLHVFRNYSYERIRDDAREAIRLLRTVNPRIRIILTVSPVAITATASSRHALVANAYTKSTLRAVAGDLADADPGIDYFPSYEMITAPPIRGMFYNPNMRTVTAAGVAFVMDAFFGAHGKRARPDAANAPPPRVRRPAQALSATDLACEEELLDAGR